MTIVIIAAAVVAAAVLVGIVVSRRRPTEAPPNHELVRAVDEMRSKMDELAGELSGALERAEQESRRNRLFGELGGSIDLEELMDRVLDAAMAIPGIEAAMMVVERQDGAPAVVTRRLPAARPADLLHRGPQGGPRVDHPRRRHRAAGRRRDPHRLRARLHPRRDHRL